MVSSCLVVVISCGQYLMPVVVVHRFVVVVSSYVQELCELDVVSSHVL